MIPQDEFPIFAILLDVSWNLWSFLYLYGFCDKDEWEKTTQDVNGVVLWKGIIPELTTSWIFMA